jgi:hypothetical protein
MFSLFCPPLWRKIEGYISKYKGDEKVVALIDLYSVYFMVVVGKVSSHSGNGQNSDGFLDDVL